MGIPFGPVVSTLCFQVSPPPAKISTGWSWDSRCWPLWVKNLWTLCPWLRPQQSWLQAVDIHSPRSCTHTACSAIQGCTYLAPEPWQCLHCNPKCRQWVFFVNNNFQFSSVAQSCLTLCYPMDCSTPGFPVHHQLPELAPTHVSNTIQPSHPLSSPSPSIRVFSKESVLPIRWPKYWSFSFSFSPSSEYSGLISFRMDWLDLLYCPRDEISRVFSNTTVQKHQLFGAQFPSWSDSHTHTWLLIKP